MTELGVRWKRTIELPRFGSSVRYLAVPYGAETRYFESPDPWVDDAVRGLLKPMYAVRVKAMNI
jgi:hypothetical protein